MTKIRTLISALICASAMLFAACDSSVFYASYESVDEDGWNKGESVAFDLDVADTASPYNFFVDVRNSNEYPYSNTFLLINTTYPDGTLSRDTLPLLLADITGNWLGRPSGHYFDSRHPINNGRPQRFPQVGHYHFEIFHGMREDDIPGIRGVGLRIEHYSAPKAE